MIKLSKVFSVISRPRHGYLPTIFLFNAVMEDLHFNKRKQNRNGSYMYWREKTELSLIEGNIIVYRENPREPTNFELRRLQQSYKRNINSVPISNWLQNVI